VNTLLSINNYYYRRGGAETVFLEHNDLFRAHGWNIVPFAMRHPNNLQSVWEAYFVDEIELGHQYGLLRRLANVQKVVYSVEARRKLDALIDASLPDIAHAHNVYHHISPSIFSLLKKRGIPVALTLHDLKIACPAYKMLTHDGICERCKTGKLWNVARNRCMKNSFPLSAVIMMESYIHRLMGCYSENIDRFFVPSKFYLEKFVEWGWPREKFHHVPNFINIGPTEATVHAPGTAFLFMGRLSLEKGVSTFVRAIALAGVTGWIVGSGPEEQHLMNLAKELNADIEFFGYRQADCLPDLIRTARALVLPSEWYENAPMSILEAYAEERPVIGAKIGGIPELVRDGETGVLFESGDVTALASEMQRFATLPDKKIIEMGKMGKEWALKDFSASSYRSKLTELYRDMRTKI
jgi:glycosyltransferase involved in cell wall biosynthesis